MSSVSETPSPTGPKVYPVKETRLEKSVRIAFENGRIHCDIPRHHYTETPPGEKWCIAVRRPLSVIFDDIVPYTEAKCRCERTAMKAMWNQPQPIGTAACEWVAHGSYVKGIAKPEPGHTARKVWPTKIQINPATRAILEDRFPTWTFVSTGDDGHDHPVAHISQDLCDHITRAKIMRKGRDDEPVSILDIHGNPTVCSKTNQRSKNAHFDCHVEAATAKDNVRRISKWGTPLDAAGNRRYYEGDLLELDRDNQIKLHKYDIFYASHCLYYYDKAWVTEVLNRRPGSAMYAVLHRHKEDRGTMNNGEQKWEKFGSPAGLMVRQTNNRTGETYTHADTEFWFNNSSWSTDNMGDRMAITWTVNMVCDEYYMLCITSTADHLVASDLGNQDCRVKPALQANGKQLESNLVATNTVMIRGQDNKPVTYPIGCSATYLKLVKFIMGKVRALPAWNDHLQRAKRMIQVDKVDLTTEEFRNLTVLSYHHELPEFTDAMFKAFQGSNDHVVLHNGLATHQSVLSTKSGVLEAVRDVAHIAQSVRNGKPAEALKAGEDAAMRLAVQLALENATKQPTP